MTSTLLGHVQHISTVYLSKKMVNTAQNVTCTIVLPEALPGGQMLVQAINKKYRNKAGMKTQDYPNRERWRKRKTRTLPYICCIHN